jgi:hypothetical protein
MLEGHEFDLQTLAELFPEGDPRVVKDDEDGRYHLESSALAQYAEDHNRMAETARELLAELLGPARFHRADLGEVKVIGRFDGLGADGTTTAIVLGDGAKMREKAVASVVTAELRLHGHAERGAVTGSVTSVRPAERYRALAATHPSVAELVKLYAVQDPSWEDLYKAYEIIKDDRGDQKAVEQLGVSGRQISHFKGSANIERHARPTGRPAKPMTLPKGRQFIRDLAERWFRSLDNSSS